MYTKINDKIISKLQSVFGRENLIISEEDLINYSRDETPNTSFMPEAVVKPVSCENIKDLIELALDLNFPITPRGGGTSLTGGPLPVMGGVVVSFEKMNRIIDIDSRNRMAVVEPGVINGLLQREAEKEGLFYPVNPASMDSCTMGGNVAEGTGGANTVRYGTTRNYLTGIKAVSGTAEKWQAGGKIVKNATDLSLLQLMCGSEGSLSVFTELVFRLLSKPAKSTWIIAPFKDLLKIPPVSRKVFGIFSEPTMIELMDKNTLDYCCQYLEMDVRFRGLHQLLIRLDSENYTDIDKAVIDIGELLMKNGAEDVLLADTAAEQEKIWKIRSAIHDAITHVAGCVCEEDVVVPVNSVAELIRKVKEISQKLNYSVVIFGHLGDGNMHLNFRPEKQNCSVDNLRNEIFKTASALGGKLSGEHGIGITKKPYLGKYIDSNYISLYKKIKKQFDPNMLLNPGKIFD